MLPAIQLSDTTNRVVSFAWSVPDNGGSEVIGYEVYYKLQSEFNYTELVGVTSNLN
jgi:hypothetical protein